MLRRPTASSNQEESAQQPSVTRKRLGEILVESGAISEGQLAEALARQKASKCFLGQALVELGYINQSDLISLLVKQCKIPHINLLEYQINPDILPLLPKEFCLDYGVLPIDKLGKILTVAMIDPLDLDTLEKLREMCPDLRIKPILCEWNHFDQVAGRLFGVQQEVGDEVSMESFGLSQGPKHSGPPAPDIEKKPEGKPGAPPARSSSSGGTAVDAEALSKAVAASVSEALREAMGNLKPATSGGVDAASLLDGMKESLQQAFAEAKLQAGGISSKELAEVMQSSLREVLREARDAGTAAGGPASGGAGLAETARQAIQALQQSQSAQEERMGQLTEAVLQVAKAAEAAQEAAQRAANDAEASAVTERNRRELMKRRGGAEPEKDAQDAAEAVGGPGAGAKGDERIRALLDSEIPLEAYTFETFITGKSNDFTVKACEAVSKKPGGEYNPFFLYGEVGLGKTHLVNAVGNAVLGLNPKSAVGYVSASRFSRKLSEALEYHDVDSFRRAYCRWDVLVLDDIQFLGGRIEAQEEFFHIFNALYQDGRQIIIAGDKPPDRLGQLEKRLVSRFGSGIVASVAAPEWETRLRIFKQYLETAQSSVPDEVLALIATRINTDVRKMIGSLRKVIAFAEISQQEISADLATEILTHLGASEE